MKRYLGLQNINAVAAVRVTHFERENIACEDEFLSEFLSLFGHLIGSTMCFIPLKQVKNSKAAQLVGEA